jgi:hypothetical protein
MLGTEQKGKGSEEDASPSGSPANTISFESFSIRKPDNLLH